MTERRRPLDDDDGQESLFGSEAFGRAPTPTPWERTAPARPPDAEGAAASEPHAAFEAGASAPVDEPLAGFDAGVPLEEAQESAYEPSTEDFAAYAFEADVTGTGEDVSAELLTGPTEVPVHDAGEELDALEQATIADREVRGPRAPLAGPTLDDVMSRVWEGLVTGLPAACPVCHGEVVPPAHGAVRGRCSSCGTTID